MEFKMQEQFLCLMGWNGADGDVFVLPSSITSISRLSEVAPTVITLVGGNCLEVRESPLEVISEIAALRSEGEE